MADSVVHAEIFKLVEHYGERGWVAVEFQSDPMRAWLVYQAAQSRKRSTQVAADGDEMIITLTETGGLQITLGTTT